MKKILLTISILVFLFIFTITKKTPITMLNAASQYTEQETDFRAAWVSYYTGDINYKNESDYKNQIDTILDSLEYYNMNAMIFHIRSNHDAWYNSKINKINSQLASVNFDKFDPLEYVITECHKRGIEFHAWLNPYRVGSTATYANETDVANAYASFPNNPASKKENILKGTTLQILNPGLPEVRDFIVDTCLEIVENYDVDAIHFDDYFYARGINDSETIKKYNANNLSTSDFRRQQVDIFIKQLKDELDNFNKTNNRYVQLGIAPTGVYKNASSSSEANTPLSQYQYNEKGDLVYPKGATLGCQMHYESYLYCDTLKWVNEEWIDYIIPQTYWSTTHGSAPFEKLIKWWNMAVKNKKVNLYAGMGMYMWEENASEGLNQLIITSNLDNVLGTSIYSYEQVAAAYHNSNNYSRGQMQLIKSKAWNKQKLAPELKSMEPVKLGSVENFQYTNNRLTWDKLDGAKFYVIYRSVNLITYHKDEIVDIVGGNSDLLSWTDTESGDYFYDVVPLSYTNTLGETRAKPVTPEIPTINANLSLTNNQTDLLPKDYAYNIELSNNTVYALLENDSISQNTSDYNWTSSNEAIATVNTSGLITLKATGTVEIKGTYKNDSSKYCKVVINVYSGNTIDETFTVNFVNYDGSIVSTQNVKYGHSAVAPVDMTRPSTQEYDFEFIGWQTLFNNVTTDLNVYAVYEVQIKSYLVTFKNGNGEIIKEEMVPYGASPVYPEDPVLDETVEYKYTFKRWSVQDAVITKNTIITAIYDKQERLYVLKLNYSGAGTTKMYTYYFYEEIEEPTVPENEGYQFGGWYYDSEFTIPCEFPMLLTADTTIYVKWNKKINVTIFNEDGSEFKKIEAYENDLVSSLGGPQKEGFQLIGLGIKENGEIKPIDKLPNNDCSLYPIYQQLPNTNNKSCKKCNKSNIVTLIGSITLLTSSLIIFRKKK